MTRTKLFAATIMAASLIALVSVGNAMANGNDFLDIEKYRIATTSGEEIRRLLLNVNGEVVKDGTNGAFGYGVKLNTEGLVFFVATTHGGVYDSETQNIANPEPVWHNHVVKLDENTACGDNLAVIDITNESPVKVIVGNEVITAKNAAYETFTGQLAGEELALVEPTDVVASFTIRPVDSDSNTTIDPDQIAAICIENVKLYQDPSAVISQIEQTVGKGILLS